MSRSNQGCYTCRIRHKKCDETRPACRACTSRNIPCHGYYSDKDRPPWLDGADKEKELRDQIKRAVKRNFKLNKRKGEKVLETDKDARSEMIKATLRTQIEGVAEAAVEDESKSSLPSSSEPIQSRLPPPHRHQPVLSNPTSFPPLGRIEVHASDSPLFQYTGSSTKALPYRDAELLMHYFDHVFPLQFRFHYRAPPDHAQRSGVRSGGSNTSRGWLLWLLIVKTGPLYHATLSLSALHQFTLYSRSPSRDAAHGEKYDELYRYHTSALRDLQLFLSQSRENRIQTWANEDGNQLRRQIEVLACGVSLISFEVRNTPRTPKFDINILTSSILEIALPRGRQ